VEEARGITSALTEGCHGGRRRRHSGKGFLIAHRREITMHILEFMTT
jgi:hypothetical protein